MMIRVSMNVLYSSAKLLKRLHIHKFRSMNDLFTSKVTSLNTEEIFEFSETCGWVALKDNCEPSLTREGVCIAELSIQEFGKDTLQRMLSSYVLKILPSWSNRIPYGRKEAFIFMSKDEKACFKEAGLLDENPEMCVIEWWDKIAMAIRQKTDLKKNDVGRLGEQLTIEYELKRTGVMPQWISIDSNLAGFDIKSQVSDIDGTILLIEVKATSQPIDEAYFHVTANEWQTAMVTKKYLFYLWQLKKNRKLLATLHSENVEGYIPSNNMSGEWESVKIPYSSFEDFFVEI